MHKQEHADLRSYPTKLMVICSLRISPVWYQDDNKMWMHEDHLQIPLFLHCRSEHLNCSEMCVRRCDEEVSGKVKQKLLRTDDDNDKDDNTSRLLTTCIWARYSEGTEPSSPEKYFDSSKKPQVS